MFMSERRERMVELINGEGCVTFSQLKDTFPDVSEMTLRTDLKTLDEQHLIIRVHGGAKSVGFAVGADDSLARRMGRHSIEKAAIAQKAVALIRPGCTIFIDAGSTAAALAAAMEDMELTVFTNSLMVASELIRFNRTKVFLIGGRLYRCTKGTGGARAIESVRSLTFDQAFLGVVGYQRGEGFSCESDDEAVLKSALIERSRECVMLMDSSKEERPSIFRLCDLSRITAVVSDGGLSDVFVAACDDAGVTLL